MLLELLMAIDEFREKHPKLYKANWMHFQEVISRSAKIIKEVYQYFEEHKRASRCVIALFHNELSYWTRNEIAIIVRRQDDILRVEIRKGYKLDKWYKVSIPSGYSHPLSWYTIQAKKVFLGASDVQTR